MRSFTNRKGEKVQVSNEHLDKAVAIKLELQKSSPSGRCNWSQLKQLMHEEGFLEAENSENYRCLIKDYQRSKGNLPEFEKHANVVADKKIDSIKNLVGELGYAKRDAQNQFRELNKVKRNIIDKTLFIEEVTEAINNIEFDKSVYQEPVIRKGKNSMVVIMSDWHIGLKSDTYDYKIAKEKVRKYADNVIKYANTFEITDVKVVGIGDLVEGAYMRSQQAYDIEFHYSEQIVKATEIVNSFLIMLSQKLNVSYLGSIVGNHSRMHDKGKTIEGDNAENIIDASIKSFINMMDNPRIIVEDKKIDNYNMVFNVNGKNIKAVHGDFLSKNDKSKINKLISSDNIIYDLLLYGHFHSFSAVEENNNRLSLGVGCLQGSTDFSKKLGYDTIASQGIVIFEDDNIIPIKINL